MKAKTVKPRPETVAVRLRLPKRLVNTLAAISTAEERPLTVTIRRGLQEFVDQWLKPAKE